MGERMAEKQEATKVSRQQLLDSLQGERMKVEMVQREIGLNRGAIQDITNAQSSVKAIQNAKEKQIMVSLGGGVYMETVLDKQALKKMTNTVMMGAKADDILKELQERRANIEKNIELLIAEERKSIDKYISIQQVLQMADETYMKEKAKQGK